MYTQHKAAQQRWRKLFKMLHVYHKTNSHRQQKTQTQNKSRLDIKDNNVRGFSQISKGIYDFLFIHSFPTPLLLLTPMYTTEMTSGNFLIAWLSGCWSTTSVQAVICQPLFTGVAQTLAETNMDLRGVLQPSVSVKYPPNNNSRNINYLKVFGSKMPLRF